MSSRKLILEEFNQSAATYAGRRGGEEGWHNNHYNPKKATFGERWWEIDVAGLIIKMVTFTHDTKSHNSRHT